MRMSNEDPAFKVVIGPALLSANVGENEKNRSTRTKDNTENVDPISNS